VALLASSGVRMAYGQGQALPPIKVDLPPPPNFNIQNAPEKYPSGEMSIYGLRKKMSAYLDKDVQVKAYLLQIYECPAEQRKCNDDLAAATTKGTTQAAQIADQNTKITNLKNAVDRKDKAISELNTQLAESNTQNAKCAADLQASEVSKDDLGRKLFQCNRSKTVLKATITQNTATIATLSQEKLSCEDKSAAFKASVEKALNENKTDLDKLVAALTALVAPAAAPANA